MPLLSVDPSRAAIFPPDFKFGVAEADLQVIGEKYTMEEEGSLPTMWRQFTIERGMPTPDDGIDRYHRWREDIGHMRRIGIKHYRTSVSMARVLTEDGVVNKRTIEWYRRYFEALRESGITIYATLYHWELPQHLNERGGWTNRDTAHALERHAEVVTEELGDLVDEYFLFNEPWCSSMLSYYENIHAPGSRHSDSRENLKDALMAAHHLLLAQGLTCRAILERKPDARIVSTLNFQPAYAVSTSREDMQAALFRDGYYNMWFLDPTFRGRYPEWMVELYGDAMPADYEKDMGTIRIGDKLHGLGVNYYRGGLYRAAGGELESEEVIYRGGPTNSLDWPIFRPPYYSEGLYDILQQVYFGYRAFGLKRIYVTENGMALVTPWDGQEEEIDDGPRIEYLQEHLHMVYKALLHGIPVEGYFTWTLMDNFEWAEGYRPEAAFGLIHVDRKTLTRVPKKSARWYSELIRTHNAGNLDGVM